MQGPLYTVIEPFYLRAPLPVGEFGGGLCWLCLVSRKELQIPQCSIINDPTNYRVTRQVVNDFKWQINYVRAIKYLLSC